MACFNPPGSISNFEYVICGVNLDTENMGNGRNLIRLKVNNYLRRDKSEARLTWLISQSPNIHSALSCACDESNNCLIVTGRKECEVAF